MCKIYANSAEEFINETDKFEEQLFDNQIYRPRRIYTLFKRAIQGSAKYHLELWLTRQPGYGMFEEAQKTEDPRIWLALYNETMHLLARFAGWNIENPYQLARLLWNRVSFEKSDSRASIEKTLNTLVRARTKMLTAVVFVDFDKNLNNGQQSKASWFLEKMDLDHKIPENTRLYEFMRRLERQPRSWDEWYDQVIRHL